METVELVKLIGGAFGLGGFAIAVYLQLREQTVVMREHTAILASVNRKHARTEVLTIATFEAITGKRVKRRVVTSPIGVRTKSDSDAPTGPAVSRTTSDDFEDLLDG